MSQTEYFICDTSIVTPRYISRLLVRNGSWEHFGGNNEIYVIRPKSAAVKDIDIDMDIGIISPIFWVRNIDIVSM